MFLFQGLRDFQRNYVQSGLVWLFAVFFVFLAAWQLLWWALVEYVLSEQLVAVSVLFEGLSFIVGFIFFAWLSGFRSGYLGGPQSLSSLTQDVVRLCQQLLSLLQPFERNLAPERARHSEVHVTRFVRACQTLLCDLYALRVSELQWRVRGERAPADLLTTAWIRDEYFPTVKEPWEGSSAERIDRLVTVLTAEAKWLETNEYLSGADFRLLYTSLDRVVQALDAMVAGSHLRMPPYIENHSSLVIGVWFGLVTPATLAHRANYWAVLVYPVLMILFFGFAILSTWLRGAFARSRPWRGMDFGSWCDEAVQRLDTQLQNYQALGSKAARRAELRSFRDEPRPPPPTPADAPAMAAEDDSGGEETPGLLGAFGAPPPDASDTVPEAVQLHLLNPTLAPPPAQAEHRRNGHRRSRGERRGR